MRVSILSTMAEAPWGGSEELWAGTAIAARQAGWDVHALLPHFNESHPKRTALASAGVQLTAWTQPTVRKWSAGGDASTGGNPESENPYRSLFEPQPDLLIISHGGLMDMVNGHVGLLSQLWGTGIPYVLVIQANTEGYWPNDVQRAIMRRYFTAALQVVFVSRENLEIARRQLADPLDNAVVWQQPVNLAAVKPVKWPVESVLNLAAVARLDVVSKGHDMLIEILSRPVWHERKWRLNLYGTGPSAALLQDSAALGGICDRVLFHGQVADIAQLWRTNHVLVMPSRLEGTPLALLEALCCGRPAVVTDVGGSADWVIENETGFVAAAARTELIADALERMWQARSGLARMGEAASRFMATSFHAKPGAFLFEYLHDKLLRCCRSLTPAVTEPRLSIVRLLSDRGATKQAVPPGTEIIDVCIGSNGTPARTGDVLTLPVPLNNPAVAANTGLLSARGKSVLVVVGEAEVPDAYLRSVISLLETANPNSAWCAEAGPTPTWPVFPIHRWRSNGGYPPNAQANFSNWFWRRQSACGLVPKPVGLNAGIKARQAAKRKPRVTVIVTCYNYARWLERCVDSVLAQAFTDFEVIIVNDGSTDASPLIADSIAALHPAVVRVLHQRNSGQPAIARNNGIKAAQGELILPLDADDWIATTMLQECVAAFESSPGIGVAYTDTIHCHESGQIRMYIGGEFSVRALREQNALSCCSMYRKKVWDAVGGYRTNVRGYEDWDFWLAAAAAGFIGQRVAQPLFFYRAKRTGVFSQTAGQDKVLRAQIKLNNPRCYSEAERAQAAAFLAVQTPASPAVTVDAWRQQAAARYAAGNLAGCADACVEGLKLEPNDCDLLLVFSDALTKQGRLTDALGCVDQLIRLQPDVAEHRHVRETLVAALHDGLKSNTAAGGTKASTQTLDAPGVSIRGKKIVVYTDDPGMGGAAHYNHNLLLALVRTGASAYNAQPKHETPMVREQEQAGIKHCWLSYDPVRAFARSFTDATDAERILAEIKPDLIFFSDCCALSNIAAKQVALRLGIPYVLVCHSEAGYLAERFPQVLGSVANLLAHASEVIAVSENSRTVLRQSFKLAADRGVVIYSGRSAKYFAPRNAAARIRIRSELGLAPDAVLCLTVARHDAAKGFQFQIEAARRLHAEKSLGPLYFAWAGEGDAQAELAALIEKHDLKARIRMLGYRWDVADLMDAADVFVLTSTSEALPLCLMEAMAKGVPVVASAVGGIPEELGSAGKLVPNPNLDSAGTVAELIQILTRWANDPAERARIGDAGQKRAQSMFREEQMLERTLAVISAAVQSAATAPAAKSPIGSDRGGSAVANPTPFLKLIEQAHEFVQKGRPAEAALLLERAVENAPSPDAAAKAKAIVAELRAKISNASVPPTDSKPQAPDEFFGRAEVETIERLITEYAASSNDPAIAKQLRELQQGLGEFVRRAELTKLETLFRGDFGRVYRQLLASGLQWDAPNATVARTPSAEPRRSVQTLASAQLVPLLADILLYPADVLGAPFAFEDIPAWLRDDYVDYLLSNPGVFSRSGEAERYADYRLGLVRSVHARIAAHPHDRLTESVAFQVATKANFIPLYCSAANTREVMEKRGAILDYVLRRKGAALNATFPKRPKSRLKIKVGYLNAHFGPQTETHVALSTLRLDRSKFEICLFALHRNPSELENECRSSADSFVVLPEKLPDRVQTIRGAGLDVLIIGTNVTAVTNDVALLALYRLAPLQLASYCSPMTTGFRHVDGYLTGSLNDFEKAADHFTERLVVCDGPPGCLDYSHERPATARFDRKSLGIGDDEVVFVNAASCYKILPELVEVWARILRGVKNSRLLLLPFNPNWSSRFPADRFKRVVAEALQRHGLDTKCVVMAQSLPSRADVKELEKIADVYLDTYPFSGSLSVIDPLELGLPTLVWQGNTPRSRAGAALLRDIEMPELIADDEASYMALAEKLGGDPEFRAETAKKIRERMQVRPRFIDPAAYGRELGKQLELLVGGSKRAPHEKKAAMQCA